MALSLQNFGTLVANMGARVQGACSTLLDMGIGSVVRSIQEASAAQALWLQYLVVQVLMACRLSTSTGEQVDSWFADYGLEREGAVASSTRITVSRYVPSSAAVLLVGGTALTADTTTTFVVGVDATVAGWDATQGSGVGGYVIPAGTASLAGIPVTAAVAGSAGNVAAGTITLLGGIAGIDYCTNPAAATGGVDAETDAAMKARFPLFVAGLAKATVSAIESAISDVQQDLTYAIAYNVAEDGSYRPGHFVIVLDDGSGAPSAALKAEVYTAVDGVRAACESFSVQSPSVVYALVSLVLTVGSGSSKAALQAPVQAAIAAYVNGLGVGATLAVSRIAVIAYGVSPYVTNVSAITVNGGVADVVPAANQVVKLSSASVN